MVTWETDRTRFASERGPLLDSADDALEPAVRRMLRYYSNRQGVGVARFARAVTDAATDIWLRVFDELWPDDTPVRDDGLDEFRREFSDLVSLTERPPKGEPTENPEAFDVRVWRVTRWASVFTVNHATMWAGRAALNDPDVDGVYTEWVTMDDDRVRETHREADGQTVPIGEPFDIGGYPMLFPGDSQHAPLDEVMNCRCVLRLLTEEMMETMSRTRALDAFKARAARRRTRHDYRALYDITAVAAAAAPPDAEVRRGRAFRGVAAIEGQETGDGRLLERGALTWQDDEPVPLRFRLHGDHDGYVIGTVEKFVRDGDLIRVFGYLHDSDHPEITALVGRAVELIEEGHGGVSVGLDSVDAEVRLKPDVIEELNDDEVNPATPRETDGEGRIVVARWRHADQLFAFTAARIRELSVVDQPAIFPGAGIELVDEEAIAAAGGKVDPAFANPNFGTDGDEDPRLAWQEPLRPDETGHWGCPLTVTKDGRVYGHLATKGRCHSAYGDSCLNIAAIDPSYTFSDYLVGDATGTGLPTGVIIVGESHRVRPDGTVQTWDLLSNAKYGVADVTCGVDEHGIWVAGRVRPGATPEQVAALRGSALSGEWVPTPTGQRRLKAIVAVNTPGFAVARRPVAAAGALFTTSPVPCAPCAQEAAEAAASADEPTTPRFAHLRRLLEKGPM